MKIGLKHLKK